MMLERLELTGDLLTCVEKSDSGRCIKYLRTCDGDDCITESPKHPSVSGRGKKKRRKKTTAKKRKPERQVSTHPGTKEPWQMRPNEWLRAKELQKTEYAQYGGKVTKADQARQIRQVKELERLNYNSGYYDDIALSVKTDHKHVVAKAHQEGKSIPAKVLAFYPDIQAFVNSPGYKDSQEMMAKIETAGLAGDLLTCSRWQILGGPGGEYIRCEEYKQTCQPGDPDCAEPGRAKTTKTARPSRKAAPKEPYGAFWFNVVKGGTRINQIPQEVIGADFGDYLDADRGRSYLVFGYGMAAAEKELKDNLDRIREMRKEYGRGFISDQPTKQTFKLPGEPEYTYHVQPVTDYEAFLKFTKGHNVKDLVGSRLMITRGTVPYRSAEEDLTPYQSQVKGQKESIVEAVRTATGQHSIQTIADRLFLNPYHAKDLIDDLVKSGELVVIPRGRGQSPAVNLATEPATKAMEPEQIWMKEKPFTKDDTHDYNRYTYYPIKDLNDEFENNVKPKLDEVDRLMKEYDVTEIPAEVQTALMWYRRRAYEYLKRKIYSRNNAPGAAIVGPSNYNYTKHKKVMDGDEKYWKNLETSGRKLETAIKKTITRGTGGKPAASVKERGKWQAIAVKTKRTAFGKLVLENQIAYNKANPDKAPQSINLEDPKSTFRTVVRQQGRNTHARMILDAHQRGIEINPEVLAEYPALTANLSGVGGALQIANALYSLAKVVL